MIGVPELRTYKNVLPFDLAFLQHRPHRFAHLFFISVALSAIELTKARLQRDLNCLFCCDRIRNQRPKPEGRNFIRAVIERYLCIAKAVGVTHKTTTSIEIVFRMDSKTSASDGDASQPTKPTILPAASIRAPASFLLTLCKPRK